MFGYAPPISRLHIIKPYAITSETKKLVAVIYMHIYACVSYYGVCRSVYTSVRSFIFTDYRIVERLSGITKFARNLIRARIFGSLDAAVIRTLRFLRFVFRHAATSI